MDADHRAQPVAQPEQPALDVNNLSKVSKVSNLSNLITLLPRSWPGALDAAAGFPFFSLYRGVRRMRIGAGRARRPGRCHAKMIKMIKVLSIPPG